MALEENARSVISRVNELPEEVVDFLFSPLG